MFVVLVAIMAGAAVSCREPQFVQMPTKFSCWLSVGGVFWLQLLPALLELTTFDTMLDSCRRALF